MSEWLDNLKAGDEVALFSGFIQRVPQIKCVERVTATQIIVGSSRFRRKDGYAPGGGYGRPRITEATQEYRDLAEASYLRARLKDALGSPAIGLVSLRAMAAALDATLTKQVSE